MNSNFEKIIWYAGHFGIIIREHVEELVYTNKYSYISANRTLAKLEREYGYLKRIDRGKRKTDGYKLTHDGIKYFRKLYGYEPKNYNSGDKLSHSIQIVNFYIHLIKHMKRSWNLEKNSNIIEEKNKLNFNVQKEIKYMFKDKVQSFIPDAFIIYRYKPKAAKVFYLEIENSNRKANYVAKKTIDNYESFYLSGKWKKEKWQPKNKIFPPVFIVCYSDFKVRELIKHFKDKYTIPLSYYFTDYKSLKDSGISGGVWKDINNNKVTLF